MSLFLYDLSVNEAGRGVMCERPRGQEGEAELTHIIAGVYQYTAHW